jgi:diguanylate cyclase (GGDEF)-like protein
MRQALVSVSNAVETFAMLGDLEAALEWCDPALALGRSTGWPGTVGLCLMQMGDVMRVLGRHEEARSYLQESLESMAAVSGSRNYEQVLGNLGQLALDTGDYAAGLDWFMQFEQRVSDHHEHDLKIKAWRGQASALVSLGRAQEAHAKAMKALNLAREHGSLDGQIQILVVLAQLHAAADIAPPPDMQAPSATLHYLLQALNLTRSISGYVISPDLLNQVATSYAEQGDFRAAYEHAQWANEARNQSRHEEAQRRALSMQVRQEMERARAETEHHRQLAVTLRETAATLETLGIIGREITASLNARAVFDALYRHVNQLLDATFFAVYLIDEQHKSLTAEFMVENGVAVKARPIAVTNPSSRFARCARTRKEILVNVDVGAEAANVIPGTMVMASLLFAPLVAGERLIGVMSIQSPRPQAYGEREQSIFRALCAYGAIALDNAAAYAIAESAQHRADQALAELRQTQGQLVEQNLQLERLAVTDQLTGLFNRLHLDRTLEEEHSRNMRYGTQFCVLLLDVDEFKAVNDTYGHQVGDQILVGIAQTLQAGVREVDVVGRWGGEEFLIICRETGLDGALVLAEKLRASIDEKKFHGKGHCSASFGAAMFHPGEVLTETIARADTALYRAKLGGRNRVENGEVV